MKSVDSPDQGQTGAHRATPEGSLFRLVAQDAVIDAGTESMALDGHPVHVAVRYWEAPSSEGPFSAWVWTDFAQSAGGGGSPAEVARTHLAHILTNQLLNDPTVSEDVTEAALIAAEEQASDVNAIEAKPDQLVINGETTAGVVLRCKGLIARAATKDGLVATLVVTEDDSGKIDDRLVVS